MVLYLRYENNKLVTSEVADYSMLPKWTIKNIDGDGWDWSSGVGHSDIKIDYYYIDLDKFEPLSDKEIRVCKDAKSYIKLEKRSETIKKILNNV